MDEALATLTDAQNAEQIALAATALFTVLFQWAKRMLPNEALLPLSMAVGAGIGVLGVFFGGADTATVTGYVLAALANAAIPTGWFKSGQYAGQMFKRPRV